MSHERRSVQRDSDVPPPGGDAGEDAVLPPPQGLQQEGAGTLVPACAGGAAGGDGEGEGGGLGFRVRRHALEEDRLGACRSAATVGGMLAKRQKSAAEEQGQGQGARRELLEHLGRAGDELLVAQTIARTDAALVGPSGRGAGGAAVAERGERERAAAVLGEITGVTVDAWRQTVVGRAAGGASSSAPPPGGAAARGGASPGGVTFAVDCDGHCDGLPFSLDILLSPPARTHPSGGAAGGGAAARDRGVEGGGRMTLRAAHLAPSVLPCTRHKPSEGHRVLALHQSIWADQGVVCSLTKESDRSASER